MSNGYFSKAADNNKDHILIELRKVLCDGDRVLEIASGTGQHADHFSAALPGVVWQTSDLDLSAYGLADTLAQLSRPNLPAPIQLNINQWPALSEQFDAVYSANCLHIVDQSTVRDYVLGAAGSLKPDGVMILYGPFKYDGAFTTESNAKFDAYLRASYPGGGIPDFEEIDLLAMSGGMTFESDTPMPANNQLLVWRKKGEK
ncbi:MAG: DUF938 domain-containing protein [Pseudomonadota bacterium]